MIVYYAIGGGLGHLTRARAFLYTLGITEPVTVLTASSFARDRRVLGDLDVVTVPLDLAADVPAFRAWLRAWLDHVAPTAMYLDVFPAGILGELCDFPFPPGFPIYHLARLLRWPAYHEQMRGTPPHLALTYLLEPLAPEHEQFLHRQSGDLRPAPGPPHPHAELVQLVAAAVDGVAVEAHQEADLVGRAAPVLGGERVRGDVLHAELERALDDVEQRVLARGVAGGAGQPARLAPTGRCRP